MFFHSNTIFICELYLTKFNMHVRQKGETIIKLPKLFSESYTDLTFNACLISRGCWHNVMRLRVKYKDTYMYIHTQCTVHTYYVHSTDLCQLSIKNYE